jgi:hypothetical protein
MACRVLLRFHERQTVQYGIPPSIVATLIYFELFYRVCHLEVEPETKTRNVSLTVGTNRMA